MPPGESHRPGDGGIEGRVDPVLPEHLTAARTMPAGSIVRDPDGRSRWWS